MQVCRVILSFLKAKLSQSTAFLKSPCLVECQGHFRRLRLVLTSQSLLTKGEKSLLDEQHPIHSKVHSSGRLAMQRTDVQIQIGWSFRMGSQPNAWLQPAKGVTGFVLAVAAVTPQGKLMMLPTKFE